MVAKCESQSIEMQPHLRPAMASLYSHGRRYWRRMLALLLLAEFSWDHVAGDQLHFGNPETIPAGMCPRTVYLFSRIFTRFFSLFLPLKIQSQIFIAC